LIAADIPLGAADIHVPDTIATTVEVIVPNG
jgi:hypothetical protein